MTRFKMARTTSHTGLVVLGLAIAGLMPSAVAFQEQGGKAAPDGGQNGPAAGLNVPSTSLPRTEIRIPGLGQIGTLPKFDFGLELLYGASEPRGVRDELVKPDQGDLQIRGTLKYKFPN
jgi:hypothetical protein